jgi:hypothetical protein
MPDNPYSRLRMIAMGQACFGLRRLVSAFDLHTKALTSHRTPKLAPCYFYTDNCKPLY